MCCTAWIAAGPPAVGELDQPLDPQQLLAVIARQPAQRHGEAETAHRPSQAKRQRSDAVGVDGFAALGRGRGRALGEPPNSRSRGIDLGTIDDRRRRVQGRETLRQAASGDGGEIGLGEQQQVGDWRPARPPRDSDRASPARPRVDRRHDAIEPQRGLEKGVGRERVEHRTGIGQAAGLERDAPERRPLRCPARPQQPVEGIGQALAHGAAGTAVGQLDDVVGRGFQQQMVEGDRAELADDDGGVARDPAATSTRTRKRRLAAAEKAGQHRQRDRLVGHGREAFRPGGI